LNSLGLNISNIQLQHEAFDFILQGIAEFNHEYEQVTIKFYHSLRVNIFSFDFLNIALCNSSSRDTLVYIYPFMVKSMINCMDSIERQRIIKSVLVRNSK